MKRKTAVSLLVTALGVMLAAAALLATRTDALPLPADKILAPLGGIAVGLGLAGLLGQTMVESDPVLRQREKEQNNERNTAIRCRAESMAGRVTVAALALGSVVSKSLEAPVWVTVLLLGFAFAYAVLALIFTLWYQRRM